MIDEETIIATLNKLSNSKLLDAFATGHDSYMDNKWTVNKRYDVNTGKRIGWFGIGVGTYFFRHNEVETITRGDFNQKNPHETLYDFLEKNTGMDTLSLKFHVLMSLFKLNRNEYTEDQARSLIITTRSLLFLILENLKENRKNSPN